MDWQTEVMLETILGYGVDIHLLGLQQTALMLGKPMPALFEDPTYKKANWFRLGTSQVSWIKLTPCPEVCRITG